MLWVHLSPVKCSILFLQAESVRPILHTMLHRKLLKRYSDSCTKLMSLFVAICIHFLFLDYKLYACSFLPESSYSGFTKFSNKLWENDLTGLTDFCHKVVEASTMYTKAAISMY